MGSYIWSFYKLGGFPFWGPHMRDPLVSCPYQVPLISGSCHRSHYQCYGQWQILRMEAHYKVDLWLVQSRRYRVGIGSIEAQPYIHNTDPAIMVQIAM